MISWWWLVIALWLGGMVGVLMAGMCRSAALADEAAARALEDNHEPHR